MTGSLATTEWSLKSHPAIIVCVSPRDEGLVGPLDGRRRGLNRTDAGLHCDPSKRALLGGLPCTLVEQFLRRLEALPAGRCRREVDLCPARIVALLLQFIEARMNDLGQAGQAPITA